MSYNFSIFNHRRDFYLRSLIYISILAGIILRCRQYLANRNLWLDESYLALNIRNKNFVELTQTLDYFQTSSFGYLWTVKLLVIIFGDSEYVLRVFSLIMGVLALWLIFKVTEKGWDLITSTVSVFLLAIVFPLIYYSSELKQYMSDLAIGLGVVYLFLFINLDKIGTTRKLYISGLAAAILLWFSYTLIFVIASLAIFWFIKIYLNRKKVSNPLSVLSYLFLPSVISFSLLYITVIHNNPHTDYMLNYWREQFLPLPFSYSELLIGLSTLKEFFMNCFGITTNFWLVLSVMLISLWSFYSKKNGYTLFLFLPVLLHIGASMFKLYPFDKERLTLYLIPFLLIFFANGISYLIQLSKWALIPTIILLSILLYDPLNQTISFFSKPYRKEEITPTLDYIQKKIRPNEQIYFYWGSVTQYLYYSPKYNLEQNKIILGYSHESTNGNFYTQFYPLKGKTWIVFTHTWPPYGMDFIQNKVESSRIIDVFKNEGSVAYLVDLK